MEFERRTLLKFFLLAPLLSVGYFKSEAATMSPLDPILREAKKEPAFKKLGRKYLAHELQSLGPIKLEQKFLNHIGYSESMPNEDIAIMICNNVRSDFENDRVIDCNGWQFSKTEVLLAALCTKK